MRRGFTIVEVIATLLLLSIVFVTIPTFLSISVKSDETSLEGEALYHATALISHISNPLNTFEEMSKYNDYKEEGESLGFVLETKVYFVSDGNNWIDDELADTNTTLIKVTAKYKDRNEEIGTLRYRVSKIGAAR